jgi:hypothetical protein
MRARRGTLDSEHENGRLYAWLDTDPSNVHSQGQAQALLQEKNERIEELRQQVHHFREILAEERDARRRADTIIAQLTQANAALAAKVPELEAPEERSPDASRGEAEGASREESPPAQEGPPEQRGYAVTSPAEPGREEPRPSGEEAQEPSEALGGRVAGGDSGTARGSWWRRLLKG